MVVTITLPDNPGAIVALINLRGHCEAEREDAEENPGSRPEGAEETFTLIAEALDKAVNDANTSNTEEG